jgi:hypothetical protein
MKVLFINSHPDMMDLGGTAQSGAGGAGGARERGHIAHDARRVRAGGRVRGRNVCANRDRAESVGGAGLHWQAAHGGHAMR